MSGCRYERAIKQSLNKITKNHNSINSIVARIITEYSHTSPIQPGSILLGHSEYFIVKRVHSHHFVTGFFCPPKILLVRGEDIVTVPRLNHKSRLYKKRVFSCFKKPEIRLRLKTFNLVNESM